ncbi:MAG: cyclic nucleotide-binding domain-containing protein, partial [Polyangiales bacterium]
MVHWAEDLGTDAYRRSFSAGATLFYAGAPASELYLIATGRVQLFKRARGVERSIGLHGPEELVGEEALLPGTHRNATAQAIETTQA